MDAREFSRMALLVGVMVPVLALAQTREPGTQQATQSQSRPGQAGSNSANEVSYTGDSLSTAMTGIRAPLGPGDLIDINVFDTPELTQKIRVNSEGKIKLALIGEIGVQGMTPDELERLITTKLVGGHFMKKPEVAVFVAEYAGQMAYISGEVVRPGAYSLLRSHRLLDLIAVSGGLSARAGNVVTIKRQGEGVMHVDLSNQDPSRSNPEIMPGDSVSVEQAGIVYVLGDVERPGGFMVDRRVTLSVMQALALAEGLKPSAGVTKVRLIRTTDSGRQDISLDVKLILKAQKPDLTLQAGDIIYVPSTLLRGMGRLGIQTILATASGVAIYAYRP